ncbi:MAG: right-handed parallel beta-helix repeat-containing protein [bacterium]|nr:right-handed parallel beta-helix repeat-containing protein [bacterium]
MRLIFFLPITNNIISGNSRDGIYCYSSSPIITNNTISGNNNSGICCSSASPSIINNTISENSWDGIYCSSSSSPNIYNNIITENGTTSASNYGIYSSSGSIDYNCIWGNGYGSSNNYSDCFAGLHDISVNPRFIGGGNYHLQANSPCINKGTNTIRDLPETDRDGNPRILQTTVDMGAYESCYPGTITGNIFYSGTNTGNLYCFIIDKPDGKGNPIASNIIPVNNSGIFKYEISLQNPGTYYLTCFFNADGNNSFGLGNMAGIYGSLSCVYLNDTTPVFVGSFTPINIRAGDIIPNINVNLNRKISPLYFKVVTQHNNIETAGTGFGVTLIVTDYDGNPAGTPTGTIGISCSWNAASSTNKIMPVKPSDGNIIFTAGNAFLGTFTLVNAGEKPCITVRSGLISGTSTPITVNASSPTTLLFSAPGIVTAGNTFLLGTITACDIFGNTATSYMGNKLLTYSGPGKSPANIAPSYTNPVNFEQGISTTLIQTTLTKAEIVQLHITDKIISGTATVVVLHGTATGLTIEPALGAVTSGAMVSCRATAHDMAGNTWTVTADTIFNSNDPCGTISGGIYTAGKAGTWTITGKYAGLSGTTTVVVTPGTASKLAIESVSAKWFKDEPGTITIAARDKNGNLAAAITTFQLEPARMITSDKATIINGMAAITVKISMVGPVVITVSNDNICGSISLNLLMRKEQQAVGTFTTGNGLETKVVVPENTLPIDYYVIIGTPTTEMHKEIGVAANRLLTSQKIIPDTMREFNLKDESGIITLPESSKVTITIPYTDSGIDRDRVREDTLRIYRLVYGKWEMVEGKQIQDFVKNCVSAQVNAFSVFALIGETYPADFSQLSVFPNPCNPSKGEKVNFQGLTDNINISIYNLAGELAWEKQGIVGGSTTWDGRNDDDEPVASGTYIYVIRDANENKKTGKVAVIW